MAPAVAASRARRGSFRRAVVALHRYVGLAVAAVLVVAGLTGAVLAFRPEIDRWLNADLYGLRFAGPELSPVALRERAEALYPEARVDFLELRREPGRVAWFFLEPRPGPAGGGTAAAESAPAVTEVYLDPTTGERVGEVRADEPALGRRKLTRTLVDLHYRLLLGEVGLWIAGLAALFWFLDHFYALWLAFPSPRRWAQSFRVRWRAGGSRLNFDLHRATALWLWPLLLLLALTGVDYNIGQHTVAPAVNLVSPLTPSPHERHPALPSPLERPRLGWQEALDRAHALVAEEGRRRGFAVTWEQYLALDREKGLYRYQFRSSLDIRAEDDCCARTVVLFDADTGAVVGWEWPLGETAGDAFYALLSPLHVGALFGLPHRIALCVLGLATAALSVTGVLIWLRRRNARGRARARGPAPIRPVPPHPQGVPW
jgi:uncharacterized iron-regulated membrane protein